MNSHTLLAACVALASTSVPVLAADDVVSRVRSYRQHHESEILTALDELILLPSLGGSLPLYTVQRHSREPGGHRADRQS